MLEERLLKILIREILNEENVKLRTPKGYGASHPVVNRKPFMTNLGTRDQKEPDLKKKTKKSKPVKVSKVFDEDIIEEYESILEELIYGKAIH